MAAATMGRLFSFASKADSEAPPRRPARRVLALSCVTLIGLMAGVPVGLRVNLHSQASGTIGTPADRQEVFELLRPVRLENCELQRFGEKHDGGYLLCGNLLSDVQSAYSYGISGYDGWGCDVSTARQVPVHQYDCFDTTRPACPRGRTIFHEECVGDTRVTQDDRFFDTLQSQIARNGDTSKRLVMKMDVEGAEWSTFMAAPDDVLSRVDQLVVEFHGVDATSVAALKRLREFFEVAYVHYNNATCLDDMQPLPAWAYEVLFVNKRLAVTDPERTSVDAHPQAAPNIPFFSDCQVAQ